MSQTLKDLFRSGLIPDWVDKIFLKSVTPLIHFFSKARVSPNWITACGFFQNVIAAVFIIFGHLIVAGLLVGTAGIFDFIDGKVASLSQKVTKFGAIFDSILDRYSDIVIYLAIALLAFKREMVPVATASLLAMIGSLMTSYIKAIGESHGYHFRSGALRRQERVTLICAGLVLSFVHGGFERLFQASRFAGFVQQYFPFFPLSPVIYFLAIFTNLTALQRFYQLRRISTFGPLGASSQQQDSGGHH
jgi:CDP-diacylglycerol--glycerol-3-phosphate 3-phosphatidyltransferase